MDLLAAIKDFQGQLEACETKREISAFFEDVTRALNFEYFLCGIALPRTIDAVEVILYDSYPEMWRAAYDSNGYSKKDPIVKYSLEQTLPIRWSTVTVENGFTEQDVQFMGMAGHFGLGDGFSLPFHLPMNSGFGMISLAMKAGETYDDEQFEKSSFLLQGLLAAIIDKTRKIDPGRIVGFTALTKREKEVLALSAEGSTLLEIAYELGISERTVVFHKDNAREKLGAKSRTQALTMALLTGALNPLYDAS